MQRRSESDALNGHAGDTRFRELFNTLPHGVLFLAQPDGEIVDANPAAERLLGLSRGEMLGRTPHDDAWQIVEENGTAQRADEIPALVALRTGRIVRDRVMGVFHPQCKEHRWLQVDAVPQFRPGDDQPYMVCVIFTDVSERKTAEKNFRGRTAVLEGINRIFRKALTCQTEEEVGSICLTVAEEVTSSCFGFIGELTGEGRLCSIAISDPGWQACRMDRPGDHRISPAGFAVHGIYGRVLSTGKGLFTNDPAAHPDRIGLPQGHPPLQAFLGVPLIHAGRTFGMVGVANRAGGYRDCDLEALEMLAPAFVQVLLIKRGDVALARHRELLQLIFDNIPVLFVMWDPQLQRFTLNRQAEAVFGWTTAEANQGDFMSKVYPDPAYRAEVAAYMQTLETGWREWRVATKDGKSVPIDWANIRLTDDRRIGIGVDLRERKKAEAAIGESEEKFSKAFYHSPTFLFICELETGVFIEVNEAYCRLLGYTPEEMINHSSLELGILPARSRAEIIRRIQKYGRVEDMELEITTRSGEIKNCLFSAETMEYQGRHCLVYSGIDITERKRAEDALRESNQELREYIYALTHNLKAPLRAIHNYVGFLSEDLGEVLKGEPKMYLDGIIKSISQSNAQFKDLEALYHIKNHTLAFECIDMQDLVEEIRSTLKTSSDQQLTFVRSWPIFRAERFLLRQILMELIKNGFKFNRARVKRVEVGWKKAADNRIEIFVRDNGIGIAPLYHEQIFHIFKRLHTDREFKGTGIGLAIVKRAVQKIGGSLWVDSQPGEGSTFYFNLPGSILDERLS
jgi:hypothetical protein